MDHQKLDEKGWQGLVQLRNDPEQLKAQMERKLDRLSQPMQVDKINLYQVDQELEKLTQQEKRLLDAYREGIIELDELREQKAKVAKRLHVAKAIQKAIRSAQEGAGKPDIALSELLRPLSHLQACYEQSRRFLQTNHR